MNKQIVKRRLPPINWSDKRRESGGKRWNAVERSGNPPGTCWEHGGKLMDTWKISQLVEHLNSLKEKHGDLPVWARVDFHGGDYGGYNCNKKGPVHFEPYIQEGAVIIEADEQ